MKFLCSSVWAFDELNRSIYSRWCYPCVISSLYMCSLITSKCVRNAYLAEAGLKGFLSFNSSESVREWESSELPLYLILGSFSRPASRFYVRFEVFSRLLWKGVGSGTFAFAAGAPRSLTVLRGSFTGSLDTRDYFDLVLLSSGIVSEIWTWTSRFVAPFPFIFDLLRPSPGDLGSGAVTKCSHCFVGLSFQFWIIA